MNQTASLYAALLEVASDPPGPDISRAWRPNSPVDSDRKQ